ncbi:hypothetical protein ACIBCR_14905 [Micromonospora echinospora]|uniref:hypothetical protein n=1 Tax=Micromonospora echinospora TaxID=1877 RepID=UPI0037987CCC
MNPGDWISTGWGAQHRIRSLDGNWIVLVCHFDDSHNRVHRERINFDANDALVCNWCEVTPGLGPMPAPTLGEVRRDPTTGATAVCERTWDDRAPSSPVDLVWLVTATPEDGPAVGTYLSSYAVVGWEVLP